MVPAITYHMLHNPKLAKLDLSSLAYATAGAAYLPPELRVAFERRAKNLSFFFEGLNLPCLSAARAYGNPTGYGLSESV